MDKLENLFSLLTGTKQPASEHSSLQGIQPPDSSQYDPNSVSVVLFSIGRRALAIAVENTEGVVDCPHISPLPSAPDAIVGVVSVRGRITLVLDASLEGALQGSREPSRESWKRRLILLRGDAQLGLLADQIQTVLSLGADETRQLPENRSGKRLLGGISGGVPGIRLARSYFKHGGRKVPILDLGLLSELSN
jgi:chemotaxis signal transduction protein